MNAAIKALNPYDDANYIKYITTVLNMDHFNWIPCMKNKDIADMANKYEKFESTFWALPNVDKIVKKNVEQN